MGFIGAGTAPVIGELWTCTRCGALVNAQGGASHDWWHKNGQKDLDDGGSFYGTTVPPGLVDTFATIAEE